MRSILGGLICVAATATSALAQSAGVYDLTCSGTVMATLTSGAPDPQTSSQTYSTHVVVDLDHRTFCQDECKTQEAISKVLPADLVLRSSAPPQLQRFWVTEDGQFSNTWIDARVEGNDKTYIVMSARGLCLKSPKVRLETDAPVASKPAPVREVPPPRPVKEASSTGLDLSEISALVDIKNHRPVSAKLHTELVSMGYIHLQDDLWTLTAKAEALVSGDDK